MPAIAQWRHRGVAYWENAGDSRIVWATGDGFLLAVDAKTGIPDPDFGVGGRVDLTGRRAAGHPAASATS